MTDSLVDSAIAQPPRTHEDYQIGVICALATKKAAMVGILDKTYRTYCLPLKKFKVSGCLGIPSITCVCQVTNDFFCLPDVTRGSKHARAGNYTKLRALTALALSPCFFLRIYDLLLSTILSHKIPLCYSSASQP